MVREEVGNRGQPFEHVGAGRLWLGGADRAGRVRLHRGGGAVFLPPVIYIAKLLPIFEFFGNSGKNIEKGKKM